MSEKLTEIGPYSKYWKNKDGLLHRLDGPAIEDADGTKYWWQNGLLHRLDGPAVECSDGTKEWIYNGERINLYNIIFGYRR